MRLSRILTAGALTLLLISGAPLSAGGKLKVVKDKAKPAETCGEHGTSLQFEPTPSDAAKKAQKEEKLVMVLHISGHFEDPDFT